MEKRTGEDVGRESQVARRSQEPPCHRAALEANYPGSCQPRGRHLPVFAASAFPRCQSRLERVHPEVYIAGVTTTTHILISTVLAFSLYHVSISHHVWFSAALATRTNKWTCIARLEERARERKCVRVCVCLQSSPRKTRGLLLLLLLPRCGRRFGVQSGGLGESRIHNRHLQSAETLKTVISSVIRSNTSQFPSWEKISNILGVAGCKLGDAANGNGSHGGPFVAATLVG